MKLMSKLAPFVLMLFSVFPAAAQDDEGGELKDYLKYLGGYFGYDVTTAPQTKPPNMSLFNEDKNVAMGKTLIDSYLGAITVPAVSGGAEPSLVPNSSPINDLANLTFTKPDPYSANSHTSASVDPVIDLLKYYPAQKDPVTQALLNILGTTDVSNCYQASDSTQYVSDCKLQYEYLVMANVIGSKWPPIAKAGEPMYSYDDYIKPLLSQLDSDSLLAPLMYSTKSNQGDNPNNASTGLTAGSQAQDAANFIRYAAAMIVPFTPANFADYAAAYATAQLQHPTDVKQAKEIEEAQQKIVTYLANIRVYAAQSSVAISNLYQIMSRRLPQGEGDALTSQALAEFTMATWRLRPVTDSTGKQGDSWIKQINNASPATIQKETALLLAEINYQLYLNRKQEERILLTNSMMLLQNTKNNLPSFSPSGEPAKD
ncbi:MAG: type IV secretion protein IcmX [Legionella sp.]|jgi:intracellular multiplication protein IcmX